MYNKIIKIVIFYTKLKHIASNWFKYFEISLPYKIEI